MNAEARAIIQRLCFRTNLVKKVAFRPVARKVIHVACILLLLAGKYRIKDDATRALFDTLRRAPIFF